MNKEIQAAFDQLNARLLAIEARLQVLEQNAATREQITELTRLVSDTQATALNARY
jgi:hypothetical protein